MDLTRTNTERIHLMLLASRFRCSVEDLPRFCFLSKKYTAEFDKMLLEGVLT